MDTSPPPLPNMKISSKLRYFGSFFAPNGQHHQLIQMKLSCKLAHCRMPNFAQIGSLRMLLVLQRAARRCLQFLVYIIFNHLFVFYVFAFFDV